MWDLGRSFRSEEVEQGPGTSTDPDRGMSGMRLWLQTPSAWRGRSLSCRRPRAAGREEAIVGLAALSQGVLCRNGSPGSSPGLPNAKEDDGNECRHQSPSQEGEMHHMMDGRMQVVGSPWEKVVSGMLEGQSIVTRGTGTCSSRLIMMDVAVQMDLWEPWDCELGAGRMGLFQHC